VWSGQTFGNADEHGNEVRCSVVLECVVDAVVNVVRHMQLIHRSRQQANWRKLAQFVDDVKWRVVDHVPTHTTTTDSSAYYYSTLASHKTTSVSIPVTQYNSNAIIHFHFSTQSITALREAGPDELNDKNRQQLG